MKPSSARGVTLVHPGRFGPLGVLGASALLIVASASPGAAAQPPPQTDADHYTRYELLAPGSGRFRILYEVTATTPGARAYFNPIRPGSTALPEGWYLTGSSIPAVIAETADGRIRLDLDNPRPDALEVLITARRRVTRRTDAE